MSRELGPLLLSVLQIVSPPPSVLSTCLPSPFLHSVFPFSSVLYFTWTFSGLSHQLSALLFMSILWLIYPMTHKLFQNLSSCPRLLFGSSCKYPMSCGDFSTYTSIATPKCSKCPGSQHAPFPIFPVSVTVIITNSIIYIQKTEIHLFSSLFLSCSISLLITPPHPMVICCMVSPLNLFLESGSIGSFSYFRCLSSLSQTTASVF